MFSGCMLVAAYVHAYMHLCVPACIEAEVFLTGLLSISSFISVSC